MTAGTGICTITATQAADASHGAITSDPVTVAALKAIQTIVFAVLADKTLGDPPVAVRRRGGIW